MNLAAVMDELAGQLETISDLRVFAFPADNVSPPAAIVGYPETITFDVSMGRGVDQIDIPVFVVVGRLTDRTARDALGPYCDGAGDQSIKQTLQAGTYTELSSVRVASIDFDVVSMAAVDFLAAIFNLNVFGPGA